jgi:sugar-specific transcriptional regulator TrmB
VQSNASLIRQLQGLGLTDNQAKIYILLLTHYELRIQEIAQRSDIPRSSVYESLKDLYSLGLVEEVVEDNFKKVRAYPLGAMRHTFDEKISDLQRLSASLEDLEKTIAIAIPGRAQPSTALRYYRGRSGARQLYWNTLRASNTVYVYSDWSRRQYIGAKFYERFVTESRTRNIQERVLTNPTAEAMDSIRRYNIPLSKLARTRIEDIRFLDQSSMFVKGDTLIYDSIYAQVYMNNNEINGFEIESRNFIESQRSIFETLWNMARPLSELL